MPALEPAMMVGPVGVYDDNGRFYWRCTEHKKAVTSAAGLSSKAAIEGARAHVDAAHQNDVKQGALL